MAFVGFDRAMPLRRYVKSAALTAEAESLPGAAVE
jgi:hypothetical protein